MKDTGKGEGRGERAFHSPPLLRSELRATLTEFAFEVLGRGVRSDEHLEELLDRYSLALDQRLDPTTESLAQWYRGSASA